jgi:hypothetical protein
MLFPALVAVELCDHIILEFYAHKTKELIGLTNS